jgi:hypothetical protein
MSRLSMARRGAKTTAGGTQFDPAAFPTGDVPGFVYMGGEDFTTNAALGTAGTTYPMLTGYDYGEDTSKNLGRPVGQRGIYRSSKTATVNNSILSMNLHYDSVDAKYYICAITPDFSPPTWGQLYGKWAVRFRFDPATVVGGSYKVAYLLWPALTANGSNVDSNGTVIIDPWDYGEIDWPEGTDKVAGFIHVATGSAGSRSHGNALAYQPNTYDLTDWHTYSIEWIPGQVQFLLDGVVVATHTGSGVPFEKMFWALQAETWLSSTAPDITYTRTAQVDWIAQWRI